MNMIDLLIGNASLSTTQGVVGVALIGLYFCLIVGTAMYRIKKADHMHH